MNHKYLMLLLALVVPFLMGAGPKNATCNSPSYLDRGICVPSSITEETANRQAPYLFTGGITYYNPGIMEFQFKFRGWPADKFVDGVALMSCADLGKWVWMKRPGFDWEGPFLSVDCSRRAHMFVTIAVRKTGAEVGFKTAQRWRMAKLADDGSVIFQKKLEDVMVFVADEQHPWPTPDLGTPIHYPTWWYLNAEFEQ